MTQSDEWLLRVTEWLETALWTAEKLGRFLGPMAPEGTPPEWRWSFWKAFTEQEAELFAVLRASGCDCTWPLTGVKGFAPCCRLCNTVAKGGAWF